jgi:serine/threonine protein kinase
MSDRVGQHLGNYRLFRLLGQGGFAEVYLGEHIHLGTQAAIKVLHTQLTTRDIEQFRQEARTIAHLEHPHIVRVLDFGVDGTTPFLVMNYAPGGTLRLHHPRGSRLPLSMVVTYVKQVAQALQHAHNHKLIHRDIKPENMLLGQNGEVLLSDFGIAIISSTSQPQMPRNVAGTVMYMAPEQITGSPVYASDQYALGTIVYEWLVGTPPFQGSPQELIAKHLRIPPPPLHQKGVILPLGVEAAVMRTLEKDPAQRFASVQEFALALTNSGQAAPQQGMHSPTSSRVVPSQSILISPPSPSAQGTDYPNMTNFPAVTRQLTPTFPPTQPAPMYYPTVPAIAPRIGDNRQPKKKLWITLGILGAILLAISIITYDFWLPAVLLTPPTAASTTTPTPTSTTTPTPTIGPTGPVTEKEAYAVMNVSGGFCFYLRLPPGAKQRAFDLLSRRYQGLYSSETAFENTSYAKTNSCTYDSPSISNGLRVIAMNVDTGRYTVTIIYDPKSVYEVRIDNIQPFA